MNKFKIWILSFAILLSSTINLQAITPYSSFFYDSSGYPTYAPSLYLPSFQINYDFKSPKSIFVENDTSKIYITQANSLLVFDDSGNYEMEIGKSILEDARDTFVINNLIYVADNGHKSIIVFNKEGKVIKEYQRPTNPIFGKNTKFNPISLVVDTNGAVYIVSEQTNEGIIQLDANGRFMGFVGVNTVSKSSIRRIQEMIFPKELLAQLSEIVPPSINSIDIDTNGLIYTVSSGSVSEHVRKLNIAGKNVFEHNLSDSNYIRDISIDKDGNVFLVNGDDGVIELFDNTGQKIAKFGSKTDSNIRDGLLRTPIAMDINNNNDVFVLDSTLNNVQVYRKSVLMNDVFKAMKLFNDGKYSDAQSTWEQVLNINSNVAMAHRAVGMSYYQKQNFDSAKTSFKLANDKKNYSETFWEVRQAWLMSNTQYILLTLILLAIIISLIKRLNRRLNIISDDKSWIKKIKSSYFYHDYMLLKRVFKNPLDVFYDIRKGKVNINSAIIFSIILLIVYILSFYAKSYLFSNIDINFSIINEVLKLFLVVVVYMISNYLVCSIRDGEGSKKAVFIGTIYALAPYILLVLPLAILTQALSFNERFLYDFGSLIMYAYTIILLVLSVMEIHAYTFKFTISNIVSIIITLLLIIIFSVAFIVLSTEMLNFISSIIKEVMLRG